MKIKKIKLLETASELIGIDPEEGSSRLQVIVSSCDTAVVRRFERICGYTESRVELLRGGLLCEICGENLVLQGVAKDTVRITGRILSVAYTEVGK